MSQSSVRETIRRAQKSAAGLRFEPAKAGQLIVCQRSSSSTTMHGPTVRHRWVECGIITAVDRQGLAKSYRDGQGVIHLIDHDREMTYCVRDKARADAIWAQMGGKEYASIELFKNAAKSVLTAKGIEISELKRQPSD